MFYVQTGLTALKDTVVGGSTGPGLSGGQVCVVLVCVVLRDASLQYNSQMY